MKRILAIGFWALGAFAACAQNEEVPGVVGLAAAYNDPPLSCTANHWCNLQTDANGNLKVVTVGPGGGSIGSGSVNQGNPNTVSNAWPVVISDGSRLTASIIAPSIADVNQGALLGTYSQNFLTNGSSLTAQRDVIGANSASGAGVAATAITPTSSPNSAILHTQTGSGIANSLVLKANAGNLYSVYATNFTTATGYLVVVNSATVPVDGPLSPVECVVLPPNGVASISYNPGPTAAFTTGITAVLTSSQDCFSKTTGVVYGFINGAVQ